MHMSDALITPVVGGTSLAASGGLMGYAIRSMKTETFEQRLPLMGVMGAFLFAAQMINFAIPGTGSSGHIGGGMLLAIILGPGAGFITMACVLMIQALFFADGGLLAFGCNLINLGFFTAYLAYPFVFRPIIRRGMTRTRILTASILASVVGLQLGSLGVVVETWLSGRTELSLGTFLLFMQPIHLAIGLVEGVITGVIVHYLYTQNRQLIHSEQLDHHGDVISHKRLILRILAASVLVGGILSLFASESPDGLEWAIQNTANAEEVVNDSPVVAWFEAAQSSFAVLPDYNFDGAPSDGFAGTSTSGIIGSLSTLCFTVLIGTIIKWHRKRSTKYE